MGSNSRHVVQVYVGSLSNLYEALSVEASKQTTVDEIIECLVEKLSLDSVDDYELAEVVSNAGGTESCKERRLDRHENPVAVQVLWPKHFSASETTANLEFQVRIRFINLCVCYFCFTLKSIFEDLDKVH